MSGNSAGGHLSLLAAGTPTLPEFEGDGGHDGVSSAVAASIAFYPVVRFVDGAGRPDIRSFLFGEPPDPEAMRAGSPITYVAADFPPTLLIHGTSDEVVAPFHSTEMHEALRAAGVPAELHLFAEQPHGFDADSRFSRLCAETMSLFLERYVVERMALTATS
ncbi:MAG: prolyl oligopeptidase family serine peptidase [Chloroflexi bacterium]|nr:prolyl oligopeptidase family serine peptidase [Chloroflexota bacterium]MDA1001932.1 prolyl oligopeptidase family serine peptidase [Chloroflexota bacterium]